METPLCHFADSWVTPVRAAPLAEAPVRVRQTNANIRLFIITRLTNVEGGHPRLRWRTWIMNNRCGADCPATTMVWKVRRQSFIRTAKVTDYGAARGRTEYTLTFKLPVDTAKSCIFADQQPYRSLYQLLQPIMSGRHFLPYCWRNESTHLYRQNCFKTTTAPAHVIHDRVR